jgi:hypothetical protein
MATPNFDYNLFARVILQLTVAWSEDDYIECWRRTRLRGDQIKDIASGQLKPSLERFSKLCNVFGISAHNFIVLDKLRRSYDTDYVITLARTISDSGIPNAEEIREYILKGL